MSRSDKSPARAACPMAIRCLVGAPSCNACKRAANGSGRNLMECERESVRVCLRLSPDAAAQLRQLAEVLGCGLAHATASAVELAASTWIGGAS